MTTPSVSSPENKLTQNEIWALFPDGIKPDSEVAALIFGDAGKDMTIGQVRDRLRQLSREQTPSVSIDYAGLREKAETATKGFPVGFDRWMHLQGDTIVYTKDPSDGVRTHMIVRDQSGRPEVLDYIVAAQPSTVLALLSRIEALEKALEPFAEEADILAKDLAEVWGPDIDHRTLPECDLTIGNFRLARTTLSGDTP